MAKLTIILGKNICRLTDVDSDPAKTIFFPEITLVNVGRGPAYVPQHPDNFVPDTIEWILELMAHGKDVQLWTYSEYLVSWIAQAVGGGKFYPAAVGVRLYADDNQSFRRFGISSDGVLEDVGDGGWPFGWFMPSS